MIPVDQIKSLMKSGDIAGAEALCRKALETHPDDAWLKRRYGMCRRQQGDEETFRRINDEILEMEKKKKKKEAFREMYSKLWFAFIVVALVIGGAVAFKHVMLGVLVVAAIFELTAYLVCRDDTPFFNREFEMRGVLIGAAMAGIVVYFGHLVGNGLKEMMHADGPAPDVVLEVEPTGMNILETTTTNSVASSSGTPEQLSQTGSETP